MSLKDDSDNSSKLTADYGSTGAHHWKAVASVMTLQFNVSLLVPKILISCYP